VRTQGRWGAIVITLLAATTGGLLAQQGGRVGALALPEGFADEFVAQVNAPTAFAFLPDGRMLVATQPGRLYLVPNTATTESASAPGSLSVSLDLSGSTCSDLERGLLGVAVHPDFEVDRAVFVFYTSDDSGLCTHRVSRFELGPDGVADPTSERILLDRIPSPNANHNAGDLQFGRDRYLYVSVGDGGCDYGGGGCAGANDASRDEHVLLGKILRITDDGGLPAGNPFVADDHADRCAFIGMTEPGRRCQETFAWGLRNPFRLAFDPNSETTRFFINDVGQHHWEEIDEGEAGADYGWNMREGRCATGRFDECGATPPGITDPVFDYRHEDGCGAITGGAFVPDGIWPDEMDGAYLFGDYNCGTIFRLVPKQGGGYDRQALMTGFGPGGPVHLGFGPATGEAPPALYYTTYENGGEVRRVAYVGTANRAPVARLTAKPTSGPAPLRVAFDARGSADPDGDDLVFEWDFGAGTTPAETSEPLVEHDYASEGVYRARVVARDGDGARSAPAEVVIGAGRDAPVLRIASPTNRRFRVGEQLVLEASADDAEDGAVPPERLSWRVLLHHDTHTHPFLGPVAGHSVRITAPAPESVSAAANSFLEVHFTATDSDGQSTSVRLDLMPETQPITFQTEPPGFGLAVNSEPLIGPSTVTSWTGWTLDIEARDQTHDGVRYVFDAWSDGGPARHTMTTPAGPVTYTARFVPQANREATP
jgi:glucose/arabinose dehydrogenase/PKD repeat protein